MATLQPDTSGWLFVWLPCRLQLINATHKPLKTTTMNTKGIKPAFGAAISDGKTMFPILYIDNHFGWYNNTKRRFECNVNGDTNLDKAIEHCEYIISVAEAFELKSLEAKIGQEKDASGNIKLFVSFNKRKDDVDKLSAIEILQLPQKDIFGDDINVRRNGRVRYQMLFVRVSEDELKEAFEARELEYPGKDKLNYGVTEFNKQTVRFGDAESVTYIPRRRR